MTTSPLEIGNHRPSFTVDLRRAAVDLVTRPRWTVPIALALLALFGVCDYFTGIEVAFTLLYLVPVGMVTWCCGGAAGGVPERSGCSYGIIRDHGGLLEVASREEGGTRFTALLPLAEESC